MRQLVIDVPQGQGTRALEAARACHAVNVACGTGTDADGQPLDVVTAVVRNHTVGALVEALESIPALRISYVPTGCLALRPPADEIADDVRDVTMRSPLEIYLAGIQAIGSWGGLLGYAAAAAVVVWLGLYTDRVVLLVGAMLIAPFAGPAMNVALATARGDRHLLVRSLLRYIAALAVTTGGAAILSLVFGLQSATAQMIGVANVSSTALLLPIAAGAAGALHLVQDQRSSLVSGAGAGILIAASLAPPAGLVGMAMVAGEWTLLRPASFLLALQLLGINLAGAAVFRLARIHPGGPRYPSGRTVVTIGSLAATAVGLASLLAWQFASAAPMLRRATEEQAARQALVTALRADSSVVLLDATAEFTRAPIAGVHPLLVTLAVQPRRTATADDSLRTALARRVRAIVVGRISGVTPFVDVRVLR